MRDEKSRNHLGIANGEQEFALFPDVAHVIAWIERQSVAETAPQARPTLRKAIPSATAAAVGGASELQTGAPDPDAR